MGYESKHKTCGDAIIRKGKFSRSPEMAEVQDRIAETADMFRYFSSREILRNEMRDLEQTILWDLTALSAKVDLFDRWIQDHKRAKARAEESKDKYENS